MKNNIYKPVFYFVVLILLFSAFLSPVSALNETNAESNFSSDFVQEIIDNTPNSSPDALNQMNSGPKTIAVSGTVPVLSDGAESYHWFILLQDIMETANQDGLLDSHLWSNGGSVIGYGCPQSYILIYVHSEAEYTDEDISDILQIIQDFGKEYGIEDIPIVIEENIHAQGYIAASSNTVPAPAEPKTIPGVGLLACVLFSVAAAFISRKR